MLVTTDRIWSSFLEIHNPVKKHEGNYTCHLKLRHFTNIGLNSDHSKSAGRLIVFRKLYQNVVEHSERRNGGGADNTNPSTIVAS